MIKAYCVRYDEELKKTIDTHLRIDKEIIQNKKTIFTTVQEDGEFTQGIQAVIVDTIPSIEEQKMKSDKVLEDANKEANKILEKAKQEAEEIKKEVYEQAQKKGYEEGLMQANRQTQKLASDYEAKTKKLHADYEASLAELEPKMVEIMAALLERMTGILVEEKEGVILHLVSRALKNMDKSNEYSIRTAKENYEYLIERKSVLMNAIGREVTLYIHEDAGLQRNQCLIETDLHVIDCSLDVQLSNLITDLRLLGVSIS
jgi:flagellar assembly protein FliH